MNVKDLEGFVKLLKEQFQEGDREKISPETDLKTLEEWTSLQTMIIVNEIDKHYNVLLSADDLKAAKNVGDLLRIVQSKQM